MKKDRSGKILSVGATKDFEPIDLQKIWKDVQEKKKKNDK